MLELGSDIHAALFLHLSFGDATALRRTCVALRVATSSSGFRSSWMALQEASYRSAREAERAERTLHRMRSQYTALDDEELEVEVDETAQAAHLRPIFADRQGREEKLGGGLPALRASTSSSSSGSATEQSSPDASASLPQLHGRAASPTGLDGRAALVAEGPVSPAELPAELTAEPPRGRRRQSTALEKAEAREASLARKRAYFATLDVDELEIDVSQE